MPSSNPAQAGPIIMASKPTAKIRGSSGCIAWVKIVNGYNEGWTRDIEE